MKKFILGFLRGIVLGVLLLPLEFNCLFLLESPVLAQESLRDSIRSQLTDPREIREQITDPRETVNRPCEENSREGCARPIPRPSASPIPSFLPSLSPIPSASFLPSVAPSSLPSSPKPEEGGVGGVSSSEGQPSSSQEGEKTVSTPSVLGLSYTSSGRW